MQPHVIQHKAAWETRVYDFWVTHNGTPEQLAAKLSENPIRSLRRFATYFDNIEGQHIANICGSCGKKAVPLALLGAQVTIFDLSDDNCRYATELARAANVPITYIVGDVMTADPALYHSAFDVLFMEGGILHYFHDLDAFMHKMHALLRPGGRMILSDFHPFTKVYDSLGLEQPTTNYFSTELIEGEMAHAHFYPEEIRRTIPTCTYRKYTISEIISSTISSGFTLTRFDEHPAWIDPTLPGEFTLVATKQLIL